MVSSTDKPSTVSGSNVTPTKTPSPDPSEAPPDAAQAPVQLTRARFVLIFLSLMLCVFLFAVSHKDAAVFIYAFIGTSIQLDQLIVGMLP